jgi:hypothetical protein
VQFDDFIYIRHHFFHVPFGAGHTRGAFYRTSKGK